MFDAIVIWDEPGDTPDNVSHIAEHGLTPDEVDEVLLDDAKRRGCQPEFGTAVQVRVDEYGKAHRRHLRGDRPRSADGGPGHGL